MSAQIIPDGSLDITMDTMRATTLTPPPPSSMMADTTLFPPDTSSRLVAFDNLDGVLSKGQVGQIEDDAPAPLPKSNSNLILCARGTTLVTQLMDQASPGYCAIEEWYRQPGAFDTAVVSEDTVRRQTSESPLTAPVIFTGVRIAERDVFSTVACLNNIKVMYTFGQNFGDVSITGEILLGNFDDRDMAASGLKNFAEFFWKHRVSNLKAPVTVSVLYEKYLVYLVGLEFGDILPDVHIMPFVLHGVLLDIDRNKANQVNTGAVMLTTTDINNSAIIKAMNEAKSIGVQGVDAPKSAAGPSVLPEVPGLDKLSNSLKTGTTAQHGTADQTGAASSVAKPGEFTADAGALGIDGEQPKAPDQSGVVSETQAGLPRITSAINDASNNKGQATGLLDYDKAVWAAGQNLKQLSSYPADHASTYRNDQAYLDLKSKQIELNQAALNIYKNYPDFDRAVSVQQNVSSRTALSNRTYGY